MSDNDLRTAVEQATRRFEADFAAGDVAGLVANYYTLVPTVIGENVGVFGGRDGAEAYFAAAVEQFGACRLESRSLEAIGDHAFETGEVTLIPRSAGHEEGKLSYLVGWKNTADGWRVSMDYFVPGTVGTGGEHL